MGLSALYQLFQSAFYTYSYNILLFFDLGGICTICCVVLLVQKHFLNRLKKSITLAISVVRLVRGFVVVIHAAENKIEEA